MINHLELFAGIGGFRRAMDLISKDTALKIKTIAYSENDAKAMITYNANYLTDGEIEIGDIVPFSSDKDKIEQLPQIDLISGGFPCQTFSTLGNNKGFGDDRGKMFFRIMDIVKIKHPRYLLLENVKNLINHDGGNTFAVIKKKLEDEGYDIVYDVFDTQYLHLPQIRRRVIIFAVYGKMNDYIKQNYNASTIYSHFDKIYKKSSCNYYDNTIDILEKDVDDKYVLSDKMKESVLSFGTKNFHMTPTIDTPIAKTLLATMHKMHRAGQDNYYSLEYIDSDGKTTPTTRMSLDELKKVPIRKLTPRECFALQGFPKEFVDKASQMKVSNTSLYKQAGNAVSVNMIYAVLSFLIDNGGIID